MKLFLKFFGLVDIGIFFIKSLTGDYFLIATIIYVIPVGWEDKYIHVFLRFLDRSVVITFYKIKSENYMPPYFKKWMEKK